MKKENYDQQIKVRAAGWLKKALESMAQREDLELSDIVRRALKDHAIKTSHPVTLAA